MPWRGKQAGTDFTILHSFVVDSADISLVETAKAELLALIEKPELAGIPLLVLCNKTDLPDAMKAEELIDKL